MDYRIVDRCFVVIITLHLGCSDDQYEFSLRKSGEVSAYLVSHTLTVPSSLPVTIHFPCAEYAKAVIFPVCPSRLATGVLLSDGMSHILHTGQ